MSQDQRPAPLRKFASDAPALPPSTPDASTLPQPADVPSVVVAPEASRAGSLVGAALFLAGAALAGAGVAALPHFWR